ncbi:MAG TPA: ABC transporter [Firmicutes bacterium]|nr:ABC transporter [Bacillota bacterium]HBK69411.1 ABC transporter [Bacillota bacterium]HBT16596.1 ABC transporter [Bacillota bacterium]
MKRLLSYVKQSKWYFIFALFAMLIGIALDMINPHLLKIVIDEVIIKGKTSLLASVLLSLFGITLGRTVLGYAKEYLFDYGGQKVVAHLRADLFAHLQSLSFDFFDRTNTGELMSRMKDDVDNIWGAMAYVIMLSIENLVYFVIASLILFSLNWKLSLLALVIMPLIAWIAVHLEKEIAEVCDRISDQGAKINTTAQENLAGVRLVKAFGREQHECEKFFRQNQENYEYKVKRALIWGKHFPRIEFLTNLAVVLVTVGGGLLVINEEITIGTLVAFSNYLWMLIWPMRMSGWLINDLAECKASVGKIEKLFTEQPTIKEPENPIIPQKFNGHLVFKNVSFIHNGKVILEDINLEAKPGATIAIMGMTGAGKSSLVNLIARYYDCSSGSIFLDGVNITQLPLKLLRSQVSVVMQDTFLFSATIEENVKFGWEEVTTPQVKSALEKAALDQFIAELPQGLATIIGERGIGLSGGQKQRLAIARALVKKGAILILDDATSNLDMETEYQIQKALETKGGLTKFIIAHRISAVKNADEILIIEDGKIVERGTHQQLLAMEKRYYATYRDQFQGISDLEVKAIAHQ